MLKSKKKFFYFLLLLILSMKIWADDGNSEDEFNKRKAPPVNTKISNQATLKYTGYDRESRTLKSFPVIVYVAQIYSLTYTPDAKVTAIPGDTVYFLHKLKNMGNGIDTITLSDEYLKDGLPYKVKYYLYNGEEDDEKNNNGSVIDGNKIILEAGKSINIRVEVDTSDIDHEIIKGKTVVHKAKATSQGDSTQSDEVLETIKFTEGAAVKVNKTLSKYSDNRLTDKIITVKLEINNVSKLTAAKSFNLTDLLDPRFQLVTTAGTIVWTDFKIGSSAPKTYSLTNNSTTSTSVGNNNKVKFYTSTVTEVVNSVSVTKTMVNFSIMSNYYNSEDREKIPTAVPLNTISGNGGGYLTFQVKIPKGTVLGDITNKAFFTYDDGSGPDTLADGESNTVYYSVVPFRNIIISPPQLTGKTYIGGQMTYLHMITNAGDVMEGNGIASMFTLATTDSLSGSTSTIYIDIDNDKKYTPGVDQPFSNFEDVGGMAPGDSRNIIIHVKIPSTAKVNDVDITKIIPTVTQGVYSIPPVVTSNAMDTTMVQDDFVKINKYQSIEPLESSYTKNNKIIKPGKLVYYKIVVTNESPDTNAGGVTIVDTVPIYTSLAGGTDKIPGNNYLPAYIIKNKAGEIMQNYKLADIYPKIGEKGEIKAIIGELKPGDTATLYFNVKIDG